MFEHLVGQSLDRYTITRKIGENRLGAMFRARDTNFHREVTILVLQASLASRPNFAEEFTQAARTAVRLDHPNLVQVFDMGEAQGLRYLVLEYIPGDSLEEMLVSLRRSARWVILSEALSIVRQLALVLEYIHSQGAAPRSVLPANIKIKPVQSDSLPYLPVLTDLGLNRLLEGGTGSRLVTAPAYVSPEESIGRSADPRSDVYSLGILLFELATGQLPFPIRTADEAVQYHTRQPVPPPRSIRPDLPENFERIIVTALQKNPEARYANPAVFAAQLERVAPQLDQINTPPPAFDQAVSLLVPYRQSLSEAPTEGYEPARSAAAVTTQANPAASTAWQKPIDLIIENAQLSVEPGSTATTRVTLRNRGLSEGFFRVSAEGLPDAWVSITPEVVQLAPGEQRDVTLTVQPARTPQSRAGRYPLIVRAANQQAPGEVGETRGTVTVTAFSRFSSRLNNQTLRAGETGQVAISNLGNTQNTFTLNFRDPEGELGFAQAQEHLRIAEGQTAVAEFRAGLRQQRLIGSERTHPFSVAVASSMGETQTHSGEVITQAIVPAWLVGVLVVLFLCVAGSFALFLARSGVQVTGGTATVLAQQTGTAAAIISTLEAETATALFLADANEATLQAATVAAATFEATAATAAAATAVAQTATDIALIAEAQTATAAAAEATTIAAATAGAQASTAAAATAIAQAAAATVQAAAEQTAAAQSAAAQTATAAAGAEAATAQAATAAAEIAAAQTATAAAGAGAATAAAATAQAEAATQTASAGVHIAYIHSTDTATAGDYRALLQENGFLVDLILQDNIVGTNFQPYRAIIVGPETGSEDDWGDEGGSQFNQLIDSGLPILGLGEGGNALFIRANLGVGWVTGITTETNGVAVVDPNSPVWSTPNQIPVEGNQVVPLYNANTPTIAITVDTPAVDLTLLGQLPDRSNHYPIIRQNNMYLLWGYHGGPAAMTSTGEQLFENVMRYLLPPR